MDMCTKLCTSVAFLYLFIQLENTNKLDVRNIFEAMGLWKKFLPTYIYMMKKSREKNAKSAIPKLNDQNSLQQVFWT